jgi:hypothetical protein
MHNEYIKLHCIRNEKDKLLLLKYDNIDITSIKNMLLEITLDLMSQCYNHIILVDDYNKRNNKNYDKIKPIFEEQIKDMNFIRNKFIEYFNTPGPKTKRDLLTYVLAFQITISYYNEYLYATMLKSLKSDYTSVFWKKYNLNYFELDNGFTSEYYILRDTNQETNVGQINISLDNSTNIINKHARDKEEKLEMARSVGNILDNYYNNDVPSLNNPYKEYMLDLVNHIDVYNDFEKAKQIIKRE